MLFSPEIRLYAKLIHALNKTTKIVSQYLAQHFIDLCGVSLTAGLAQKVWRSVPGRTDPGGLAGVEPERVLLL